MSCVYEINDKVEAIELAKNDQSTGKYNLVRGQAKNWPVIPSAGRLTDEQVDENIEKLKHCIFI